MVLGALVTVGLLGKSDQPLPPRSADAIPLSSATPAASLPWVRAWAGRPSPTPTPSCLTPPIGQLAGPIPRHPAALVPSGLRTVGALSGGVDTLVPDRDGGLWGISAGRLLRFDPRGQLVHAWTTDDDPRLVAWMLAPAHGGGVWLIGEQGLRLFDGERFRDVVPAPGGVSGLAEAPDGSLWAAVWGVGLQHWDGHLWVPVCGSPADRDVTHVAIDAGGDVWVSFGTAGGSVTRNPARYDGRSWTADPGEVYASDAALVGLPDGTMWAAGNDGGFARWDGHAWSPIEHAGVGTSMMSPPVAGTDGSVWAVGGPVPVNEGGEMVGVITGGSMVRYDAGRWTVYGQADGLPAPSLTLSGPVINGVAAAGDAVFAATADGVYRFDGRRWGRTWDAGGAAGPAWIASLLPVSGDEAWAVAAGTGSPALWHLAAGRWTSVPVADWTPSLAPVQAPMLNAAYRAGVLAVAGDPGLAVLRSGRWTSLARGRFGSVAVGEDGRTVYAVGPPADDLDGPPVAATFRLAGASWRRTDVDLGIEASSQPGMDLTGPLAIDADGRWWLGVACGWSLCRLDVVADGRVTRAGLPDGVTGGPTAVAAAPDGEVWALLQVNSDKPDAPPSMLVAHGHGGTWQTFGPAQGFLSAWSSRLAFAPDGSLWVTGDGLWRYDGATWTLVRPGAWDIAFAPDGSAWVLDPSGVARLPADLAHPARLSDEAADWCAAIADWGAVRDAAAALGIDERAIEARTSAIIEARGESADPIAHAAVKRLDGQYIRACSAAFSARP